MELNHVFLTSGSLQAFSDLMTRAEQLIHNRSVNSDEDRDEHREEDKEEEEMSEEEEEKEEEEEQQPFLCINSIESSIQSEKGHIIVQLYDGDTTLSALLHAGDDVVCSAHSNTSTSVCLEGTKCKKVRKGLVILVRKYSFKQWPDNFQAACENHRMMLQVDDYFAVGIQLRQEQEVAHSQSKNKHQPVNIESFHLDHSELGLVDEADELMSISTTGRADEVGNKSEEWKCSHRLEHLGSEGIKSWSVRAYVTAFSPVTEFHRANNRGIGKFMRVQVRDTNAQLELVVFEPYCHREPFVSLKLNSQYHISEGEIKIAKTGMIKWPYEQLHREQRAKFRQIPFDIQVNKNTSVLAYEKINAAEQSYVCGNGVGAVDLGTNHNSSSSSSSSSSRDCSALLQPLGGTPNLTVATDTKQQQENATIVRPQPPCTRRLLLSDLIQRPTKSLVTVLCVVCQMKPFNADKDTILSKSPRYAMQQRAIAVRRLVVVDTSGVTVPVAMWGDQAKYCTLEVGHCVLFKEVEVSNYGGISLSVIQKSGIMCFGSCEELEKDVLASTKKHSKASRIVECKNVKDAFFQELAEWWQRTGSALYRN